MRSNRSTCPACGDEFDLGSDHYEAAAIRQFAGRVFIFTVSLCPVCSDQANSGSSAGKEAVRKLVEYAARLGKP